MEARLISAVLLLASLLSMGASSRSQNFLITAPTPQLAAEATQLAEKYRRELAIDWLGHELPPWHDVCPICIQVGPNLGAGGATSFMFDRGRPFGWRMDIQGPRDRLLDSVLPHEITHMIFATHFGRPLPRWADEGAATSVEHISETSKQQHMLISFLTTDRGIAFNEMLPMMQYPQDILPLYSQGYSLARFLIAQGGRQKFVRYVGDAMNWNNWTAATKQHYGYGSLSELQVTWLDWVRKGYPEIEPKHAMIAQAESPAEQTVTGGDDTQDTLATWQSSPTQVAVASVSTSVPFDSWYRRQRVSGTEASSAPEGSHNRNATRDGGNAPEPLLHNTTTRPQGVSHPEPMVLPESSYGNDGAAATLIGTPPPRVPLPPIQVAGPPLGRRY